MNEDLGTLTRREGRWQLGFERRYGYPVAQVWRMLTDPRQLSRWFPARVTYEHLEVNAELHFEFAQEQIEHAKAAGAENVPLVSTGTVLELDPERCFAFEWEGETLRFVLHQESDTTVLTFTHSFSPDDQQATRNAGGWHYCLEALQAALDDVPGPDLRSVEPLTERYRELFEGTHEG